MLTVIGFVIIIAVAFVVLSCVFGAVVSVSEFVSEMLPSRPEKPVMASVPVRGVCREEPTVAPKPKGKGRRKTSKPPVNEYVFVDEREPEDLYNHPSMREYVLPDGSKFSVNTEETSVIEKPAMETVKTSAERFGGGMAEIIRRRREEEVF